MIVAQWLTIDEVAEIEKCTPQTVRRWCRMGSVWPTRRVGTNWLIGLGYAVALPSSSRVIASRRPPRKAAVKQPRRGRPKGAKNKRPYPKGVKRPRKKKAQSSLA